MIVLGYDFESTAVDPQTARIIEMGAVLWDTELSQPLRMCSELVKLPADEELPDEVAVKTCITRAMLDSHGRDLMHVLPVLFDLARDAVACVTHNGVAYDRPLLTRELERINWHGNPWVQTVLGLPMIDTLVDVGYPPDTTSRRLTHLAADHGFVNPFAHRALPDVLTMLRVASGYSWDDMLYSASQPVIEVEALVAFERKELASQAGFRWTGAPRKKWLKNIKAHRLDALKAQCSFPLAVVSAP